MNNNILTIFTFFALIVLSACTSIRGTYLSYKKITNIKVITLPNDLQSDVAISSGVQFDSSDRHDTLSFIKLSNLKFDIGNKETRLKSIDIRTKVMINYGSHKADVFFMDQFGTVLYNNDLYEGSKEIMQLFRRGS